jgi:hypothetical protein
LGHFGLRQAERDDISDDHISILVGDDAVHLPSAAVSVHLYGIGVALERTGICEVGITVITEIPFVGEAVTFCFNGHLGCFAAVSIMIVGTALFHLAPEFLLGFFNPSGEMIEVGVPALRSISIPFVAAGVGIIFSNVFQALGKSIHSMICSICRQLVVLIPVAYLLSLSGRIELVWYAFPIAEIASLTYCIVMMVVLYRKTIRPLGQS